jgi:hypothetical protein
MMTTTDPSTCRVCHKALPRPTVADVTRGAQRRIYCSPSCKSVARRRVASAARLNAWAVRADARGAHEHARTFRQAARDVVTEALHALVTRDKS